MARLISRAAALAVVSGALALGASADRHPRPADLGEFSFQRRCVPDETRVYDLERRTYRDGASTYRADAVSTHTVEACTPYAETVRFSALSKSAGRQSMDLSQAAADFAGFSIGLSSVTQEDEDGPGDAALPDADQTLRGLARDLHAVFSWADAAAASGRLRRVGDSFVRPSLRRRRRGEAPGPGRELCSEVRMGLTALTPTRVTFRVSLAPPDAPCLAPRQAWEEPAADSGGPPNNYESVFCAGGVCGVRWGQARTIVDAVLDRGTGALVSAELEDVRSLKERTRCDAALEHCSPESSALSRRRFSLKLRQALSGPDR
ncbi:MAG: hypothetical protein HY922_07905 [Elusimicrobia bacterium]|nr:hypothetical protein [Elusimicrobiota bacterium]